MKIERSYIYIKEARFHAYHGVLPQEQEVGQDFLVSVRCGYDIQSAMNHDMVEVTLDYGALYQLIAHEMAVPSQLIEHVAGRIANAVFKNFPQVTTLDLDIMKVNPPIGADCAGAGVEVHLINDKTK
jgi:dihydroneopterin aldolase